MKSYGLEFFHVWSCHKIGQGQSKVIIWIILLILGYPMLHAKFNGHWSTGSGEDFLMFLPYMGVVAILVMWPNSFVKIFIPIRT